MRGYVIRTRARALAHDRNRETMAINCRRGDNNAEIRIRHAEEISNARNFR